MEAARLNALRARLDALQAGQVEEAGVFGRARMLFSRPDKAVRLPQLLELDAALDRAGIHTSADAKLLHELGLVKGRLASLKSGLVQRAETALTEFEEALEAAEYYASLGERDPSQVTLLDSHFSKLARAVKVATVFSAVGAPSFEVYRRENRNAVPPASAKLAVIEFLAERAKQNVGDVLKKRQDLDLAHELLLRMGAHAKTDRDRLRRTRIEVAAARDRVRAFTLPRTLS